MDWSGGKGDRTSNPSPSIPYLGHLIAVNFVVVANGKAHNIQHCERTIPLNVYHEQCRRDDGPEARPQALLRRR